MAFDTPAPVTTSPLRLVEREQPQSGPTDVLVQVEACGLCRTDLHVIEGELPPVKSPLIPGHQVVGRVVDSGAEAQCFAPGDRVGIAWLRHTDGTCKYCRTGQENLCLNARFTGYMADGGYAEYALVPEDFAYAIPAGVEPLHAAPLLCAGIIGYRALYDADSAAGLRARSVL